MTKLLNFKPLYILLLLILFALAAGQADAAFIYTYAPNFQAEQAEVRSYSSASRPTGVSPTRGATTAYTSAGVPTGIPPSIAATNGSGGYIASSLIEPRNSVITPANNVIDPGDSRIYGRSSYIVPTSNYIEPYSNVITRSSDNKTCANIAIPTCAAGSVLVSGGVDYNGCNLSPYCQYVEHVTRYQPVSGVTVYQAHPVARHRVIRVY